MLLSGDFVYPEGSYSGEYTVTSEGVPVREGYGAFQNPPESYEGHWHMDGMNGRGKITLASGATYEGDFVDNKFCGRGRYSFSDGSMYKGEFSNSTFHGQGIYRDRDGREWEGRFVNGCYESGTCYKLFPSTKEGMAT